MNTKSDTINDKIFCNHRLLHKNTFVFRTTGRNKMKFRFLRNSFLLAEEFSVFLCEVWGVTVNMPCSLVLLRYWRFRGYCCLQLQVYTEKRGRCVFHWYLFTKLHGGTSQNTFIFLFFLVDVLFLSKIMYTSLYIVSYICSYNAMCRAVWLYELVILAFATKWMFWVSWSAHERRHVSSVNLTNEIP